MYFLERNANMIQNKFKRKTSESVFKGKKVALMERIRNCHQMSLGQWMLVAKGLRRDWMLIDECLLKY